MVALLSAAAAVLWKESGFLAFAGPILADLLGPRPRPRARALLRARLVDILMGDWDRHRGHSNAYDVVELGFNYRLADIGCALAQSQLTRLEAQLGRRDAIARRYDLRQVPVMGLAPEAEPSPADRMPHRLDVGSQRTAQKDEPTGCSRSARPRWRPARHWRHGSASQATG